MESAWAQLVSVTELDSSAIPLIKDKFVIGRNSDCDLPHAYNKLVSGKHCYIERDKHGKVWLCDTSTNGTLLNLSIKLIKGQRKELHHGDEIHVVHKKNDTDEDIGYMFQDMEALRAETSSDLEDTGENTQVIIEATISDENVNAVTTPSPLKKRKSTEISPTVSKKIKNDSPLAEFPCSSGDDETKQKDTAHTNIDKTKTISSTSEMKQTQKTVPEKLEEKPEFKPTEKPAVVQEPEEDAIAETLVCIICQELLHDCISLQPCMHSFCAGCYSEWMERSPECPSCRLKVARINKNHIVNNLVEAYLKTRPDKKRPEAELKELDVKNKITRDMLYPTQKSRKHSDDESLSDSYDDDGGDDEEQDYGNVGAVAAPVPVNNFNNFNNFNQGGLVYGIGTPFFGAAMARPAQTICRQCRGFTERQNQMGFMPLLQGAGTGAACADATVAGPSTASGSSTVAADPDVKTFPTPPDFICLPNGNHVLCLCCMQPMPDRRHQYVNGGNVPPQQCFLCLRSYCHAYWGCHKADCHGCLAKFQDLNFGKKCLTSLILDNPFESKILENYLKDRGMSVKDLFKACLTKMNAGEYVFGNQARIISQHGLNTPVCYACGIRAFKELAYFYRRDIPVDSLPKEVTTRANCYWGKNCRTQISKLDHAIRYNHICDQSRM